MKKAIFCLFALLFLIAHVQGQENTGKVKFERLIYDFSYPTACKIPEAINTTNGVVSIKDGIAGVQEYHAHNQGIYVYLAHYTDDYFVLKILKNNQPDHIKWLNLYGKQCHCGPNLIGVVMSERHLNATENRTLYVSCAPSQRSQRAALYCSELILNGEISPALYKKLQDIFISTASLANEAPLPGPIQNKIDEILDPSIKAFFVWAWRINQDDFFDVDIFLGNKKFDGFDVSCGICLASYPYSEPTLKILTLHLNNRDFYRKIDVFSEDCGRCSIMPIQKILIHQETEIITVEGRVLREGLTSLPAVRHVPYIDGNQQRPGRIMNGKIFDPLQKAYFLIMEDLNYHKVKVPDEAVDYIEEVLGGDLQFEYN